MAPSRDDEREEPGDGTSLSEDIARRWDPARLLKMISSRAGSGRSLDAITRAKFERKLGVNLGGVRVYTGEFAERVTRSHRADAITVGSTGMILMSGSARRSPLTAAGRGLLAHELTHVAQAQRGLHKASTDRPLSTAPNEQEAERVEAQEIAGDKAPVAGKREMTEETRQLLFARVLELLEENERVYLDRNGPYPSRP